MLSPPVSYLLVSIVMVKDDSLHYGDLVLLRCQVLSGYLGSIGFLESGCFLQQAPDRDFRQVPNSRSLLFRLLPKQTFEAQEEFERSTDSDSNRRKQLKARLALEQDLNRRLEVQSAGREVYYGQEIQLQHAASGMFLTGNYQAALDRTCYALQLSETGSSGAYFSLLPQLRKEGDPVTAGDLVQLLCPGLGLLVHVSAQPLESSRPSQSLLTVVNAAETDAPRFEVNLSADAALFLLQPFGSSQDPKVVTGGAVVRLLHTELGGEVNCGREDYTEDGLPDLFVRKYKGSLALEQSSSHSLFILEHNLAVTDGRACEWQRGAQPADYCLRHFISRRLICEAQYKDLRIISLAPPQASAEAFAFLPKGVESMDCIKDGAVLHIQGQTGCWSAPGQNWKAAPVPGHEARGMDKASFSSLDIDELAISHTKLLLQPKGHAFRLGLVTPEEAYDVEFAMSALTPLQQACAGLLAQQLSSSDLAALELLLTRLIFFCVDTQSTDAHTCEGAARPQRQKCLREVGVLDLVWYLLRCCERNIDLGALQEGEPLTLVCSLCYRLERLAVQDNRANEMYCAQWMGLMLAHTERTSRSGVLRPEETLTEIMSDNLELLEHHLSNELLAQLLSLMKQSRRHHFVTLVTVLCTCQGVPVPRNQRALCTLLRSDRNVLPSLRLTKQQVEVWALDSWQSLDSLAQVSADRDDGVSNAYFLALLNLTVLLAAGRNAQLDALQTHFPLETCLACAVNPALSDLLRSQFLRLLLTLHLEECTQLALPSLSRSRTPLSYAPLTPALLQAKAFVRDSLQRFDSRLREDQPERNGLVCEVLRIAVFLIRCGVYSDEKERGPLKQQLLGFLNGTTDIVAPGDRQGRYGASTPELSLCKQLVCSALSVIGDLELEAALSLLINRLDADDLGDDLDFTMSHSSMSPLKRGGLEASGLPTNLLEGIVPSYAWQHDQLCAVLIDLLLYADTQLVRGAFDLLQCLFTKRSRLLGYLQQVQLLDSPALQDVFVKTAAQVAELSAATHPLDPGYIIGILRELTNLCSSKRRLDSEAYGSAIDVERDCEGKLAMVVFGEHPESEMQRLLRNLHAHESVLVLLAHCGEIRAVQRHCYLFLAKFCQGNRDNQELLFTHLDQVLEDLSSDVCAGLLLQQVFRDNATLCGQVRPHLIRVVVAAVQHIPLESKAWLLTVLSDLVRCQQERFNQFEVATQLFRILALHTDLLQSLVLIQPLLPFPTSSQSDARVPVEVSCLMLELDLLAACAEGHDYVKTMCRQLLPLPQALSVLQEAGVFWPLREAVLNFVAKVFLDFEFSHEELPNAEILQLAEMASADLEAVQQRFSRGGKGFNPVLENKALLFWDRRVSLPDSAQFYLYRCLVPALTTLLRRRGSCEVMSAHMDLAKSVSHYALLLHRVAANERNLEQSSDLLRALLSLPPTQTLVEDVHLKPAKKRMHSSKWSSLRVRTRFSATQVEQVTEADLMEFARCFVAAQQVTTAGLGAGQAVSKEAALGALIQWAVREIAENHLKWADFVVRLLHKTLELQPGSDWQDLLRQLGALPFALQLYRAGAPATQRHCVNFLVAALLGGNSASQEAMLQALDSPLINQLISSLESYFDTFRQQLTQALSDQTGVEESAAEECKGLLRLLQLMCEGHNARVQERLQAEGVVVRVGNLLQGLCRILHRDSVGVGLQLLDTLTEMVQGPCPSTQAALATPDVLDSCRDLLTCLRHPHDQQERLIEAEELSDLKGKTANFLLALLEGETVNGVAAQVVSSLDFSKLRQRMVEVYAAFLDSLGQDPSAQLNTVKDALRSDSLDGRVSEGFSLYILLQKLAEQIASVRKELPTKKEADYPAYHFFQSQTGCIEVLVGKALQRVYFPIKPICRFLSQARLQELLDNVSRESPDTKAEGLVMGAPLLLEEMELAEERSHLPVVLSLEFYNFLDKVCFVLAFYINLLMLFWLDFTEDNNREITSSAGTAIQVLGAVLVGVSVLTLGVWLYVEGVLQVRIKGSGCGQWIRCLSTSFVFLQHILWIALAAGGLAEMFVFSFLLFYIALRNPTLRHILEAIVSNWRLLVMSMALAMAVWFIYAFWGFLITPWMYWQGGFNTAGWGESLCQSLWQCWLTTMDNGFRLSGGIGDILIKAAFDDKRTWYDRFFMDSSYFFVFRLIFLATIAGIIIDAFAQMRETTKHEAADRRSKCFICSLDRAHLDRFGSGYLKHCAHEHNIWHYLYFLVHLKYKAPTERTGLEDHCAAQLAVGSIAWLPLLRAMCLETDTQQQDALDQVCVRLHQLLLKVLGSS